MKQKRAEQKAPPPHRESPDGRRVMFPGINADARTLGVHRGHLWQVLTGRRNSASLLKRYAALQGAVGKIARNKR